MPKPTSDPDIETTENQTTTIAVPIAALAITVALLAIAIPLTRNVFGKSLRAIEEQAIPAAENYLETMSRQESTSSLIHPDFIPEEPDFQNRLEKALGKYQSGNFKSVRSNNDNPPKIIVRLDATGTNGKADITLVLQPSEDKKFLISEGVVTKK